MVLPALCFAVTLIVCLMQNLSRRALEVALLFDAAHYFASAKAVYQAASALFSQGTAVHLHLHQVLSPLFDTLMLDGPVLPVMGAAIFAVTGRYPSVADRYILVLMQCIVQALTAVLVYLLARKLTASRTLGVVAAAAWGLYPAAVIAAGRFLTETEAVCCLLLLTAVLAALQSRYFVLGQLGGSNNLGARASSPASGAPEAPVVVKGTQYTRGWKLILITGIAGVLTAVTGLLRAALLPMALLLDCIAVFLLARWRDRLLGMCGILLGLSLVMTPWLSFTHCATGKSQLTAQRFPVHNFVSGSNIETDGWGVLPDSELAGMFFPADGGFAISYGLWQARPLDSVQLALRKVSRLLNTLWYDYRFKFLGLPLQGQQFWHLLACIAGCVGMLIFCLKPPDPGRESRVAFFIGWASIACVGVVPFLVEIGNPCLGADLN